MTLMITVLKRLSSKSLLGDNKFYQHLFQNIRGIPLLLIRVTDRPLNIRTVPIYTEKQFVLGLSDIEVLIELSIK